MSDMAISTAPRRAWSEEVRATLALSWPLVLTNLAQTALTATDVILMGWVGPNTLAAGALGSNLYFALNIFGIGIVSATSPMIAREVGRKSHSVRDVRRTVRQGLWVAAAISLPFWLILWNAEAILLAFGQQPALAADAAAYVRALQWGILPFLAYIVLRSFLSAVERPRWTLVASGLAVVFNAVFAWALIFGRLGLPQMGITGAGIATASANFLMFACLAVVVMRDRKFRRYHLFGRFWRPDWRRFREVWRLGLPIGATLAFEVTVFNAAVFLMGLIGAASLAAHSIAIQIASLAFMVPLGIGQAVTVRVGRAYGANDVDGIRRAGWTAFAMGVGFMAFTAVVMMAVPQLLVSAFLDVTRPENAPVVELAISFLFFAALFQIVDGAQAVGAGMLRGLHDTRLPMLYACFGYWGVGLPLGAVLAFWAGLEGRGIWIGLATGLAVVAALMLQRWLRRDKLGIMFIAR